jgi:hypothetical protein
MNNKMPGLPNVARQKIFLRTKSGYEIKKPA